MNIIQITPKLPPAIDGIGDYSFELAKGLFTNYGILTHFVTLKQEIETVKINNFPVVEISTQSPINFLESLPKNINKIILHYSDFPYDQKYASPFWLLKGLEAVKRQYKVQLLIMFHEFPYIPTLNKNFYLFPFQSFTAWQFAEIADIVFTNNSNFKNALARRLKRPITSIPVFSNIGEPEHLPPLEKRNRRLVVFGTPGRRARVYQKSLAMLINTCRLLKVEEIYDVGASINLNNFEISGVRLVEMGKKPAEEVSNLLLNSLAGIAYSNNNSKLAKSGVFATYCAHGVVPVITQNKSALEDGIIAEQQFLFAENQYKLDIESLQTIANNAYGWYANHSKSKTVEVFASQLLRNIL